METCVGAVFDKLRVYDAIGGLHAIDYINPLALMRVAAAADKHFFDMVSACLQRDG